MTSVVGQKSIEIPDWDVLYRQGTPPWDAGRPHSELVRVVEQRLIRPCATLEVGCGSGADAVYLARRRFEVTAVDSSALAIERARVRAEEENALLRFVLDDVFQFGRTAGQFDFVYDAGLYHCLRTFDLERYVDLLWRVTKPGSYYLTLAGSTDEKGEGGPPRVSEQEIREELGRLFEFVHLQACRLESPRSKSGYAAWSCLMHRPVVQR